MMARRTGEELSESHRDVIVVGAGWSGLVACKYMLEEGLSIVALEKRENIGGIWRYTEDPTIPSVMKSTQTTSSSTVTEMSDFPMPKAIGMFPHHTDVLDYLESYAKEFNLLPHIKLNSAVTEVKKHGETWRVVCCTGDVYTSRYLIIAAGVHQIANRDLEVTALKGYTGKVVHSIEVKEPLKEFKNGRVLILGGGETSSDICMDWVDHARFIYWSIPRGQHFFRKYAKAVPWGTPQALDKASSRMMKLIAPYHRSKPGLAWICKWTTNGSLLAYQGHGIPEWRSDAEFFKASINKNGKVLDLVDYQHVVPKGAVVGCRGKEVEFIDGSKQEFDLVIMSTGYNPHYDFLPKRYQVGIRDRHKMVFDVEDPSAAFVGQVRPIVGSLVGIFELQSRWVSKVFAGKIPLKPVEERRRDVEVDIASLNDYFKGTSQRIEGLVEGFTYIDDIAKHANIYPDYWSLFKKSPRKWFVAFFSPYNGSTFRLNEPEGLDRSLDTMRSHKQGTLGILQYLLIVFLRFVWFDWWVNRLSEVKYRIQMSAWWGRVISWRLTRALNYVWTRPKAWIFDTVSNDVAEMSHRAKLLMKSHPYISRHLSRQKATLTAVSTTVSKGDGCVNGSVNNHLVNGLSSKYAQPRRRDSKQ